MLLRLARSSDLPAVMTLVRRVVPRMRAGGNLQWGDDYPDERIFARDIERAELWVAEPETPAGLAAVAGLTGFANSGGRALAGVAAINTTQAPEYAQVGWDICEPAIVVHRLAVDPAYRGTGIASALMQQAETIARARTISVLRVDTGIENAATPPLFAKLGFTLAGEISLDFRLGLRVLCYEKRLAEELR